MNEIEKLYKLVGCEKYVCMHKVQKYCDRNGKCSDTSEFTLCLGEDCKKEYKNIVFDKDNDCYFSPEKQLELIKLISITKGILIKQNRIFIGFETGNPNDLKCSEDLDLDFSETLACLINVIWQDLTESEKAGIKRILENE